MFDLQLQFGLCEVRITVVGGWLVAGGWALVAGRWILGVGELKRGLWNKKLLGWMYLLMYLWFES